jgi:hypothetical protein
MISITYTGETSKGKLLGVFGEGESPTKGIAGSEVPWTTKLRARAFVLFPGTRPGKLGPKHGVLDVDGEVVPQGPIYAEVIAEKVKLLVPPWFVEGEWGGVRAPWSGK